MDLTQILITTHYIKTYTTTDIFLAFTLHDHTTFATLKNMGKLQLVKQLLSCLEVVVKTSTLLQGFQDCTFSIYASGCNSRC